MIARIKNANLVRAPFVNVPNTILTFNIIMALKEEGFINILKSFTDQDIKPKYLTIALKFKKLNGKPYITNIVRVSSPGQRVYFKVKNIPKVWGGMGVAICLFNIVIL